MKKPIKNVTFLLMISTALSSCGVFNFSSSSSSEFFSSQEDSSSSSISESSSSTSELKSTSSSSEDSSSIDSSSFSSSTSSIDSSSSFVDDGIYVEIDEEHLDYYVELDTTLRGEDMGLYLHNLMIDSHDYYVTYGEIRYTFALSDGDPDVSGNLIDFYTKESYSATWDGGTTFNREHVWCKSLSNGLWPAGEVDNYTRGGGSDILHIRPVRRSYNSSRSDNKYAEITSGGTSKAYGTTTSTTFEPFDNVKGNVARELFYIFTHYTTDFGGKTNSYTGDLNITDIVSARNEQECWNLLLSWNELDPVEESEIVLNDYAESVQGNRNPFIDCPEFATAIWGV